ncbi:hypothetical protein KIN20_015682 [Parelaphostrongylus tenuis]|uniref:Uncharacterized protein n=1 Tax=Parelaphostrongylus tenuis TaxID=148309 RepID=A0AAD5MJZ5_PARTN|nr:hypothetical protein KIN20_015682 [Parelaphostrongylus tenuis]
MAGIGQLLAPGLAIAFMSKVEAPPVMDLRPPLYFSVKDVAVHCGAQGMRAACEMEH